MLAPMSLYDVIIIGGGPGGSTAGSALAQQGKKVLILEREKFPRFHVGESLIPFGNEELRAIGVWDQLTKSNFVPKLGAEFVLGNSTAGIQIVFGKHLPPHYAQTFQVERSRFDNILIDHAASSGCEVWQETLVQSFEVNDDGAKVVCKRGDQTIELQSRWLLDASGRDAFLGKRMNLPKDDLGMPKKFATFAHFKGVKRNDPPADGYITIVRLDFGWFWMIPLDEVKTSIGLVQTLEHYKATGLKPNECFEKVVASYPEIRRRMENAERVGDYNVVSDYTYRYEVNAGNRWLLIGDAAGFIDPIFSSGVMLSIKSGYLAANKIISADQAGTALSLDEQKRYTKKVGQMSKVFLRMIKMFYDRNGFEVFMTPAPDPQMEWAVFNLVAGNTDFGWWLRLKVQMFYAICAIQKYFPIVPRLDYSERPVAQPVQAAA
jgi:flavin-dependent dehydrogenase